MSPLLTLTGGDVAAIVGSILVLLGVLVTAYIAFRSNQSTSAVAIAGTLAARVTKLETDLATATEKHAADLEAVRAQHSGEIEDIRGQLTMSQRAVIAAVRFIDRLVEWGKSGGGDRMPTPPRDLHEFLDPDMWGTTTGGTP